MYKRVISFLLMLSMLLCTLGGCGAVPAETESLSTVTTLPALEEPQIPEIPEAYREVLSRSVILLENSSAGIVAGGRMLLPEGIVPCTLKDLLYIPALFVTEGLSGSWSYDADTQLFSLVLGQTTLLIPANGDTMNVNGTEKPCRGESFTAGEELMVCAEDYCEATGMQLQQDEGLVILGDGFSQGAESVDKASAALLSGMLRTELQFNSADRTTLEDTGYAEIVLDPSCAPIDFDRDEIIAYGGDLFLENLSVTESPVFERGYRCSMTVYNYLGYYYGIVEVYDKDGILVQTEQIEPYEGTEASIGSWFKDACVLIKDLERVRQSEDWDYLAHRSSLNATKNDIIVDVPPEGYVLITNNPNMSDQLAVYNAVHMIVELILSCRELIKLFKDGFEFESCKSEIKEHIIEELLSDGAKATELGMDFRNIIAQSSVSGEDFQLFKCLNTLWSRIAASLTRIDVDLIELLENAVDAVGDVGDAAFTHSLWANAPPAAAGFYGWKITNNLSYLVCLLGDMMNCQNHSSMILRLDGWRKVYANYLKEHLEAKGHANYYTQGKGRFALEYLTDDGIPELVIIDEYDNARVYTCEKGEVRCLGFACGWTDVVRFPYETIYWDLKGNVYVLENGTWLCFEPWEEDNYDYILCAQIAVSDSGGSAVFFDEEKMILDGYSYRQEAEPQKLSEMSLLYRIQYYEYIWSDLHSITETDIYKITPEDIMTVLGY